MVNPSHWANAHVRSLNPYKPGKPVEVLERELGIENSVKLASNENPLGASPHVKTAIRQFDIDLARYPDADGYQLKAGLSKHLGVESNTITLGNGSEEIMRLAIQSFAAPGQSILISEYSFIVYELMAQALNVAVQKVPLRSWRVDVERILSHISSQTKLIFVANPGNPIGTYITHDEVEHLLKNMPEDVLLVLDEAYFEYIEAKDYPQSIQLLKYPNLVVTRTFSKAYGLAGLRIGYSIAHPDVADMFNRVRQAFNTTSLTQLGALSALADQDHIHKTLEVNRLGLQRLCHYMESKGIPIISHEGNFITVALKSDAYPVYQALLKLGVIVRPLQGYGLNEYLRISIGLEHENDAFIEAFDTLGDLI